MAKIQSLGSWEEIMETLKQRLEEQKGRHEGGSKWIGTGGTSPYGNGGYNPEGVRIGGGEQAQARAQGLGEARIPQPRQHPRAGHAQHQGSAAPPAPLRARGRRRTSWTSTTTIEAHRAMQGWLDIQMRPERHNAVKLLLLPRRGRLDGPAHQASPRSCSRPATTEFKNLEFFYFHNCLYEGVWKDNRRRFQERTPTRDILHKYGHDYKLVFVGDASMSPYEITHPGGSVEHFNEEAGAVWMQPRAEHLSVLPCGSIRCPREQWGYTQSVKILRELLGDRMYPHPGRPRRGNARSPAASAERPVRHLSVRAFESLTIRREMVPICVTEVPFGRIL